MQASIDINCYKYGLPRSPYGLFWNFCVNAPAGKIRNVFCTPHTDSKNGAILLCTVFVYYYGDCALFLLYLVALFCTNLLATPGKGDADKKIWLVFWEAGLIIQVPVGVFIVYPSALFLHFNVNIDGELFTYQ